MSTQLEILKLNGKIAAKEKDIKLLERAYLLKRISTDTYRQKKVAALVTLRHLKDQHEAACKLRDEENF